jgi:hypothetical protein
MTNPECSVTVTVYRIRHGDGMMYYGARFEYLGSRNYPRRSVELMEPVPFDELYDAIRGNPPHLALNLEGAAQGLETDHEWTTVVELPDGTLEAMYMYE